MYIIRVCTMYRYVIRVWTTYDIRFIVLWLNNTSTLVGHFVLSPREREKRDSRGDERGKGKKEEQE